MSSIYYMRDNHTFLLLPEDDVDAAIEAIRHAYMVEAYSCGMLCTKRPDAPPHVHGLGREGWSEFEARARHWLTAMLKPYKSPGDLEYESWRVESAAAPLREQTAGQPVAVRYRTGEGRWRYLNYPFTKGWDFPESLGTPVPLYEHPPLAATPPPDPQPTPERQPYPGQQWKCGNEFLPFHPQASHVSPDYRDGWNRCYRMAVARPADPQGDGWRPIRSAPRDGTRFLAVCAGPHIRLVRYAAWDDRLPIGDERGVMWPDVPTHWRELPKPPGASPERPEPDTP